jgi:ubiquinone biosynthesis protein COQ9
MQAHAHQELVERIARHAVFDGWSAATLARAASEAGISEFEMRRHFPRGAVDVLDAFAANADARMLAELAAMPEFSGLKIRQKIAACVMVRLRQNLEHREAVRRAIGFYALPWNAPHGLNVLYRTVDAMWRAAGDTSTDYNFYTKRLLLAGVFQSTVAVWLDDADPALGDTEAFLHRRIENVMQIEKAKVGLRQRFGVVGI